MLSDVLTGKFIKINKDIKISLFISGYTNVVLSLKKKKRTISGALVPHVPHSSLAARVSNIFS